MMPRPTALRLAQIRAAVWRFRTLNAADRLFAGVPQPYVLTRRLFGFQCLLDTSRSNAQRLLFLEGPRFMAEREILKGLARQGDQVVDVGANIGYYLLLWERIVGPGGFVYCIEPEPNNLVELRRNVEVNGFRNVTVLALAAGARDGTARLRLGINGSLVEKGPDSVEVRVAPLERLVEGQIHVIKIDVEGYEGEVLEGAVAILERAHPALFIEVHPWLLPAGWSVARILTLLRRFYERLDLWEPAAPDSPAARIAVRYGLLSGVRRIPKGDQGHLEGRDQPFWLVCQPPAFSRPSGSG